MKNVVVVKKAFSRGEEAALAVWYAGFDDAVVLMESNIGTEGSLPERITVY